MPTPDSFTPCPECERDVTMIHFLGSDQPFHQVTVEPGSPWEGTPGPIVQRHSHELDR